jgi:hypothetical protein
MKPFKDLPMMYIQAYFTTTSVVIKVSKHQLLGSMLNNILEITCGPSLLWQIFTSRSNLFNKKVFFLLFHPVSNLILKIL